jgi:hypothetical protein
MENTDTDRKCSACQSQNLQYGSIGIYRHTFLPRNKPIWVGYDMRAYVCLDCGTVGYYLDDTDIQELRARSKKEK